MHNRLLFVILCAASCTRTQGSATDVAPKDDHSDLGRLIADSRTAFRSRHGAFEARGSHHFAEVRADQTIRMGPVSAWTEPDQLGRSVLEVRPLKPTATPPTDDRPSNTVQTRIFDAVQQVQNSDANLELQWNFARRPVSGSWSVAFRISGLPLRERRPDGLFFSSDGQTGVLLGPATWIDAAGARRAVSTHFEAGVLRYDLDAQLLDGAAYPAVLDPTFTPVLPITTPGPAPNGGAFALASSFDGTSHLVSWYDGVTQTAEAVRIAQGSVLDSPPLALASNGTLASQNSIASAAGGGTHLVAFVGNGVLSCRLVAANATVGLPFNLPPSPGAPSPSWVRVAYTSGTFLVAWLATSGISDHVFATRISPAGQVLDATPLDLGPASGGNLSVAAEGGVFLAAFGDATNHVLVRRISTAGAFLELAPVEIGTGTSISAAASGGAFIVGFVTGSDLVGVRMLTNGAILDLSPFPIFTAPAMGSVLRLVALSDGDQYRFTWAESHGPVELRSARVTSDAGLLDPNGMELGVHHDALLASSSEATESLVVWAAGTELKALRIGHDGGMVSPFPTVVRSRPSNEERPLAAANGSEFFAVWADTRGGAYGTRIDFDGGILDDPAIPVALVAQPVAVAAADQNFLVVVRGTGLAAVRVGPGGNVRDAIPLPLSNTANTVQVAVAARGPDFAVSWVSGGEVRVARVLGDGGLPDPAGGVRLGPADSFTPAIAPTDGGFAVAWTRSGSVHGALVDSQLVVQDGGVSLFGCVDCDLRMAAVPGGLALGVSSSTGTSNNVRLLSESFQAGVPQPGLGSVRWDGRFLLALDGETLTRRTATLGAVPPLALKKPAGCAPGYNELGSDGVSGKSLLVFPCGPSPASHVYFQVIDTAPGNLGTPCSGPYDCQSGFCVDGVCCNTPCTLDGGLDCLACSVAAGAGTSGLCSPAAVGTRCRDAGSVCDVEEFCEGTNECPLDGFLDAGAECLPGFSCSDPARCDGLGVCVYPPMYDAGTPCSYGNPCRPNATCGMFGCFGPELDCPQQLCRFKTYCYADAGVAACPLGVPFNDGQPCFDGGFACLNGFCIVKDAGSAGDAGIDGGGDAGTLDSGQSQADAGATDAGWDGGVADAGRADAGANDAGYGGGAGGGGGGGGVGGSGPGGGGGSASGQGGGGMISADGGPTPVPVQRCGCSSGPGFMLLALVAPFLRRRRRG